MEELQVTQNKSHQTDTCAENTPMHTGDNADTLAQDNKNNVDNSKLDALTKEQEPNLTDSGQAEQLDAGDNDNVNDTDSIGETGDLDDSQLELVQDDSQLELVQDAVPEHDKPVRILSEEELAALKAEIDALEKEAELDKATDKAPTTPKILVVENVDDSQELADEVGISNVFDQYGREILEPVFENRLRMSKNGVKLAYSKLKNTILSYKGVKQRYVNDTETFTSGDKLLFLMEIGQDSVLIYLNIDADKLDKEKYGHDKSAKHENVPTKLIVKKERDRKQTSSLERALDLIEQVMEEHNLQKYKVYVPVAYAQRYPFNPNAVLRGEESREPDIDAYKSSDYDPIEGEITMNIIEELMPPDHSIEDKKGRARLDAMRQQAKTIKAAVAMTEPIVYFYDSAVDSESMLAYMNVQQVLNDKFMGKVLPQQYFAIAESSDRIVDLNMLTLKRVVEDCNQNPKIMFATKVSARLLGKKTTLDRLLKTVRTDNHNLILAFDSALLEAMGEVGLEGVTALKQNDIKIMIDGTENSGLKILTEYPITYLRFDARYYKENVKSTVSHLDMLTGYCKVQGIITTTEYVENTKVARFFQTHGVDLIQGPAVCEPKRTIYNAVKGIKKLPTFRR